MLFAANGPQAPAQGTARYQRTLLAIQQQIEAGNLDQARAAIDAASKAYPADGGLENLLGVVEIQQGHADSRAFNSLRLFVMLHNSSAL